jgi:hypothetical protein
MAPCLKKKKNYLERELRRTLILRGRARRPAAL